MTDEDKVKLVEAISNNKGIYAKVAIMTTHKESPKLRINIEIRRIKNVLIKINSGGIWTISYMYKGIYDFSLFEDYGKKWAISKEELENDNK